MRTQPRQPNAREEVCRRSAGGLVLHIPGRKSFPKARQRQGVVGLGEVAGATEGIRLPEVSEDQDGVVSGDIGVVSNGEVEILDKSGLVVMGEDPGKGEELDTDILSVVPMEEGPVTLVGMGVLSEAAVK